MVEFVKKIALIVAFLAVSGAFALAAYVVYKTQDPTAQVESLLLTADNRIEKALFSPDDEIKQTLITLINNEKRHIKIAAYTLTERSIAQAIINAHARGVIIEVVTDRGYASDKCSRIPQLANAQIPVWIFQTPADERKAGLMHNKFMIFEQTILDRTIVSTGSYNFTKRAGLANQENVIISDSPALVEAFTRQFEVLKSRSLPISGGKNIYQPVLPGQKKSSLLNWIEKLMRTI